MEVASALMPKTPTSHSRIKTKVNTHPVLIPVMTPVLSFGNSGEGFLGCEFRLAFRA
jgi:hypothetical protein